MLFFSFSYSSYKSALYITNTPPGTFSASTFSVCCGFAAALYATAAPPESPLPSRGGAGGGVSFIVIASFCFCPFEKDTAKIVKNRLSERRAKDFCSFEREIFIKKIV